MIQKEAGHLNSYDVGCLIEADILIHGIWKRVPTFARIAMITHKKNNEVRIRVSPEKGVHSGHDFAIPREQMVTLK